MKTLIAVLFALLVAAPLFAQTTGTITGVVVDQSGGAISGATVTLQDENGPKTIYATTDDRGGFTLTGVPAGRHVLRVEKSQFAPARVETSVDPTATAAAPVRVALTVAGVRESVDVAAPTAPYVETTASMATKTDTPIMQTPFSIDVVPNQVIADQQGVRLSDVTRNVSGVQNNWGYGQIYEGFAIRGFETNTTLQDGMRAGGEANGRTSVDMANVENVEVLKGPAAMLYGRLEPGGLVNVVTKQPQATPQFSIQQQIGSYSLSRTTADATGPLTSDGTLLYRVIGEYFRSDSFFTHAPVGKTQFVAPSLMWKPNTKFQASLNVEYRNYDPLTANGVPAIGTRPADIPVTTWVGDTTDWVNVKKTIVHASASYVIDHNWKLRATALTNSQTYDAGLLSAATADEGGNVGNAPWFIHSPSNGRNVAVDLTGHVQTGEIGHTMLVGTDYYDLSFSYIGYVAGFGVVDTINVFNPVYNRPTGAGSFSTYTNAPPDWHTTGTQGWNSLYAQDQIKLSNQFQVLVGGRFDWPRMTAAGVLLDYAPPGTTINDLSPTTAHDTKFSPRLGALYMPATWLSFYGNYVQSLGAWGTEANIAVDIHGQPLPPEESSSYEGGVKAEAFGGRLRSTVAVFNITKKNVATRDLSSPDPTALLAIGEARSRGVDVDVNGQITARVSLIATYAFDAATVTADNTGLQGNELANVPRHSGSVWLKGLVARDLFVGGGAVMRGERQGDTQNTFQLPGYVSVDAFASYRISVGHSKIVPQMNVTNLTNGRYYINTNNFDFNPRAGIMPGQPRSLMASIRWEY
jgi:iron complex outermembrane recepter protein